MSLTVYICVLLLCYIKCEDIPPDYDNNFYNQIIEVFVDDGTNNGAENSEKGTEIELETVTEINLHQIFDDLISNFSVSTNETENLNNTGIIVDSSDNKNSTTNKTLNCKPNFGGEIIEIVNSSRLLDILNPDENVTSFEMPGKCVIVLFYAKWCPFSALAAKYLNALPRAFPDIKMVAIDAMTHHIFNAQYGVVGVPTLILLHNGRPMAKFNQTEYRMETFVKFIFKNTGLLFNERLYVTSNDFKGPLSSTPEYQRDYCLGLSWMFIIVCGIFFFTKSKYWTWIVETVQNTWRESEAQHEHTD